MQPLCHTDHSIDNDEQCLGLLNNINRMSVLITYLTNHLNKGVSSIDIVLKSVIMNDRPNKAKCSYYLGPGGWITRRFSPLTDLSCTRYFYYVP